MSCMLVPLNKKRKQEEKRKSGYVRILNPRPRSADVVEEGSLQTYLSKGFKMSPSVRVLIRRGDTDTEGAVT